MIGVGVIYIYNKMSRKSLYRDEPILLSGGPKPETVLSHLGGHGGGAQQILSFLDAKSVSRAGQVDKEFRDMQTDYKKRFLRDLELRPHSAQILFTVTISEIIRNGKYVNKLFESRFKVDWKLNNALKKVSGAGKIGRSFVSLPNVEEYLREIMTYSTTFQQHMEEINNTKIVPIGSLFNLPQILASGEDSGGSDITTKTYDAEILYDITKINGEKVPGYYTRDTSVRRSSSEE